MRTTLSTIPLALTFVLALPACNEEKAGARPASSVATAKATAVTASSVPSAATTTESAVGSVKPAAKEADLTKKVWRFDDQSALPQGFSPISGRWEVLDAIGAPSGGRVLAQQAKSPGSAFNVLLTGSTHTSDVTLEVKLRAIGGHIDQGGGLVWRAKDGKNYYVARYNPLEDNFRAYRVVDGNRIQIGSADVRVAHEGWHTMKVTMRGNHIEGSLDGKKYLDLSDDTFSQAGRAGLWSKADAVTHFDDLTVEEAHGG